LVRALSKDLFSLNDHVGRHVWEFDPTAGTQKERDAVEKARAEFTRRRFQQQHSSDALLRMQCDATRETRGRRITVKPPKRETYDGLDDDDGEKTETEKAVPRRLVDQAMRAGIDFYQGLQDEDGHWASDYGGPMFLLPGLVISLSVMGELETTLDRQTRSEMRRYLRNHQNLDGGFGLHIEGHSTMFGTVLCYVALRILGVDADGKDPDSGETHDVARNARSWIISRGGAVNVPSWGKFYLCVLGAYEWEGLNPIPPEAWLLPYKGNPLHPGRFWCHCRMVYLPMCYLYGKRVTGEITPLVLELRRELYAEDGSDSPYARVDWDKTRNTCAKEDLYYPHPWLQDALWWGLTKLEPILLRTRMGKRLRAWACRVAAAHVEYEDENTRYVDIGPVNKAMNALVAWHESRENPRVEDALSETPARVAKHLPRVLDYLWLAEDGMKMQGYNGSQLWDCAFAAQAIAATGLASEYKDCLKAAHGYIADSQVRDDCPGDLSRWYRHISKGAWPFSTRDHGWPISDCSSEGLKAALALERLGDAESFGPAVPRDRLGECADVILSYQNAKSGGWATYENTRSYAWVEVINPAETFGDIMIDYPYVECSSASIQALVAFARRFPDDPRASSGAIADSVRRGGKFLRSIQRPDGSWYGSWAVCFTYGTWFGVKGLLATGSTYDACPAVRRAVAFLLSKQISGNGGWGESYLSCQNKKYVQLMNDRNEPVDHIVNTSWAMLALIASGQAERDASPLHAAAKSLMRWQDSNGDFPQQTIMGVFNNNCMITYANYRNVFPLWALGEYARAVHGPIPSPRIETHESSRTPPAEDEMERKEKEGNSRSGKPPLPPAASVLPESTDAADTPASGSVSGSTKPEAPGSIAALSSAGESSGGESPDAGDGGGGARRRKPRSSGSQKKVTSSKKKGKGGKGK
jgi:cycloartenol synthase